MHGLRISMPSMPDELGESVAFFEGMMKESYGEFKFRKALQILEEHPGDIYSDERAVVKRLNEVFGVYDTAEAFLHEGSSFLLMRQAKSSC